MDAGKCRAPRCREPGSASESGAIKPSTSKWDGGVNRNKRGVNKTCKPPRKKQTGCTGITDAGGPSKVVVETVLAMAVGRTKRKASKARETPAKKKRGDENTGANTAQAARESAEKPAAVKGTKRKASTARQTPSKRKRGDDPIADGGAAAQKGSAEEAATAKGTKRRAGAARQTAKRTRGDDGGANPAEAAAELVQKTGNRKKNKKKTAAAEPLLPPPPPADAGSMSTRAVFESEYEQLEMLGEGGFGSVYAGYRKADLLPVAIKHIPKSKARTRPMVSDGRRLSVPVEVLLMQRASTGQQPGRSVAVSLINWYKLDQEFILVMERPVPSVNLMSYMNAKQAPLQENEAKNIMRQLVDGAIKLHSVKVFHRDIKVENILLETSSAVPRVRVIDFGCGCFERNRVYTSFSGTCNYAPPEVYNLSQYRAGPTTVWQLGALMFDLLSLQQFSTLKFLLGKITTHPQLSQDGQDFLMMCLARDPEERATLEQLHCHPWLA